MPHADSEVRKAYARAYNRKNSEHNVARVKRWKADNPSRARAADFKLNLNRKYGITTAEWHDLLLRQAGECEICGCQMTRPYVDHDHATGKVRALLCRLCNMGLGSFADSPASLRMAAEYLERFL